MPINYEKLSDRQQQDINDYLTQERVNTDKFISDLGTDLTSSQNDFLTSVLSNLPQNEVQASLNQKLPELNIQRQDILGKQRFDRDRMILNTIGNEAFDLARRRGLGLTAANDFARRYMNQMEQQNYLSSENAANRDYVERRNQLDMTFLNEKNAISDRYNQNNSLSILGPILGTTAGIGTAYAMRPKQSEIVQPINQQNLNNYTSAMNRRYYGR